MSGYFDGLAYEWSDENRVYTVSMSQQDYQQFLTNKSLKKCPISVLNLQFIIQFFCFLHVWGVFSRTHDESIYFRSLTHARSTCSILILHFTEAAGGDAWASQTKMLFLTEEEFNEYKTEGYFRGIKYRWTSQNGSYTVYISKSSYDKLRQNMESGTKG